MFSPIQIKPQDQVRVVTRILDHSRYVHGAPQKLDKRPGRVTKATNAGGRLSLLVEFDTPADPLWEGQRPTPGFWFASSELIAAAGHEDKFGHIVAQLSYELSGKAG